MLAIVGTIPDKDLPLLEGEISLENGVIFIHGNRVSVNRGTPALLAAAIKTGEILDQPAPLGYLVGDIGLGDGSRRLYEYLTPHLERCDFNTIVFHYLQEAIREQTYAR